MLNPQDALKKDIEKIEDDETIERISIFVAGILAQQGIEKKKPPPALPPAG